MKHVQHPFSRLGFGTLNLGFRTHLASWTLGGFHIKDEPTLSEVQLSNGLFKMECTFI